LFQNRRKSSHCRANVQQLAKKCSRINVEEWQSG
jgi:hypothetical protein